MRRVWTRVEATFPHDSVARLMLQLILVGLVGGYLASYFSQRRAEDLRQAEAAQERAKQAVLFVDDLAALFGERLFHTQLVYWELALHNETSSWRQELLKKKYAAYYDVLVEWNAHRSRLANSMGRHFDHIPSEEIRGVVQRIHQRHGQITFLSDFEIESAMPVERSPAENLYFAMQREWTLFHRDHLKSFVDKRLEHGETLSADDLASLRAGYNRLRNQISLFPDALYDILRVHEDT